MDIISLYSKAADGGFSKGKQNKSERVLCLHVYLHVVYISLILYMFIKQQYNNLYINTILYQINILYYYRP